MLIKNGLSGDFVVVEILDAISGINPTHILNATDIFDFVDEYTNDHQNKIAITLTMFGANVGGVVVEKKNKDTYAIHIEDGSVVVWIRNGPVSYFPKWTVVAGAVDAYLERKEEENNEKTNTN